ncbi:Glucose-1-phosphate thymidylyltransferase [Prochlorococcus marinus str. NATL2A]|uniref:Glucose-1-phosphate thymidylyltransferase n=1 Tax=Prochlorococcus marinus (strain NATL2A) TaxID=59920 RepID=Q46IF1_PROMT|nr:glucose-1-phosphate thymidylyltransferase RfbA [Prochlorococcus marinus]AAZ58727.1 Glucose-1-phosphate thymidylyltransferase [Prochlorococcus marinus str. NATL2A]
MQSQSQRKGIIIAGGIGKRLLPSTYSTNKHLFLLYDKPMIYYPLTTLMLGGIKDILIITLKSSIESYNKLLGDGGKWGINIQYSIQEEPKGIADAILLGEEFVGQSHTVIILGDNIFHGNNLYNLWKISDSFDKGSTIFAYQVSDPERYGVVDIDTNGDVLTIDEKPKIPKSNFAITGLYFYDNSVFDRIRKLNYSSRNELEVTSLNNSYIRDNLLKVELLGRGMSWFDAGTFDSFLDASLYIKTIQSRQGLMIGCPEEVAFRQGWIDRNQVVNLANTLEYSRYGEYLNEILESNK